MYENYKTSKLNKKCPNYIGNVLETAYNAEEFEDADFGRNCGCVFFAFSEHLVEILMQLFRSSRAVKRSFRSCQFSSPSM